MKWRDKANVGLLYTHDIEIYGVMHRVRVYPNRLAISRADKSPVKWDDANDIKAYLLGKETIAVEVYPADSELVNLWPTTHIWYGLAVDNLVKGFCRHPEFNNA